MRSSKTILVVEDEIAIRRLIELMFSMAGYNVLTASDGDTALRLIRVKHPDAVITDLAMPKLDGKMLCALTDSIKETRPFLTVIVTGRISPDEQAWVKQMRDTLIMEKPFSPTRLMEAVDGYLGVTS